MIIDERTQSSPLTVDSEVDLRYKFQDIVYGHPIINNLEDNLAHKSHYLLSTDFKSRYSHLWPSQQSLVHMSPTASKESKQLLPTGKPWRLRNKFVSDSSMFPRTLQLAGAFRCIWEWTELWAFNASEWPWSELWAFSANEWPWQVQTQEHSDLLVCHIKTIAFTYKNC